MDHAIEVTFENGIMFIEFLLFCSNRWKKTKKKKRKKREKRRRKNGKEFVIVIMTSHLVAIGWNDDVDDGRKKGKKVSKRKIRRKKILLDVKTNE